MGSETCYDRMKPSSIRYTDSDLDGYASVAIEVTAGNRVKIVNWPDTPVDAAKVVAYLRDLATKIEKLPTDVV